MIYINTKTNKPEKTKEVKLLFPPPASSSSSSSPKATSAMGISLISLIDSLVRRSFAAAGLRPHSIPIDADTTVHCWISRSLYPASPNPNPNPKKPTLLLIHGFGPDATWQWRPQVRALSRRFDLVVPDLVFFGRSTTRSAERSEAFQAACVDRLLGRIGVGGPVHVVGTSYGGFVAYHLAAGIGGPGRVGKVVIASSDVLKGAEDDAALRERAGGVEDVTDVMLPRNTGHLRKLVRLAVYKQPRFLPEFLLRDIVRNLYKDNLEEKLELIKGLTLGKKEFQITPLPQEVLILWGEHDQIFPLAKAYELKKQLGEKAKLEIVRNTGHMPQVEDPNRFTEVLVNFLLDTSGSSM